jgi:hypothetical protein
MNLRVMELLDAGHVETFGKPEPVRVKEGTDIKVYTHGEMLPAHVYPKLGGHPNLAGHYGSAWQEQKKEFAAFPGPVIGTTNCVLIPPESYRERLFTMRATAAPGALRPPSAISAAAPCRDSKMKRLRNRLTAVDRPARLPHASARTVLADLVHPIFAPRARAGDLSGCRPGA